jgi:hypothetical protein
MEAPSMESRKTLFFRPVYFILDRITTTLVTGRQHLVAPSTILVQSSGNQIHSKIEKEVIC